jgi:hypothetical protein
MAHKTRGKLQYIDDLGPGPTGRTDKQVDLLKRVFAGMELMDATFNLHLTLKPEDGIGAIPRDLQNCQMAKCSKRLFGSENMVFMRTVAYVDLEGEDGIRRCYRFSMGDKIRTAVRLLDEEEKKADPGVYILYAPTYSSTLDKRRAYEKVTRKKPDYKKKRRIIAKKMRRRKAIIKATGQPIRTINKASPVGIVRSGTGLIQTNIAKGE